MKTVKKEKNNRFQKFQTQKLSSQQAKHLKGGGTPPVYEEEW